MKDATITIRVDQEFKDKCDSFFESMGLTTSVALSMYLHKALHEGNMLFVPGFRIITEEVVLDRIPVKKLTDGRCVLPADCDNPSDDIYEQKL